MSITNCGMFRFGGGQTFKKPTLKEWEGLFAVMTFKLEKDLTMGSVGKKMSQAEGISWVTALRWVRAWHIEKLKWASDSGTSDKLPMQNPEDHEKELGFYSAFNGKP